MWIERRAPDGWRLSLRRSQRKFWGLELDGESRKINSCEDLHHCEVKGIFQCLCWGTNIKTYMVAAKTTRTTRL